MYVFWHVFLLFCYDSVFSAICDKGLSECTNFLYGVDFFFFVCRMVDSRDIMELELKQLGCELIIRKKEALPHPQPPITASVITMQPQPSHPMLAYQPLAVQAVDPASAAPSFPKPALPALPAHGKTSESSHPPLKCPMAGTFYRSPAPGEPPFVKVSIYFSK